MAEAKKRVVKEERVIVEEFVDGVVLELSQAEAEFIMNYLGNTVTGRGLRQHSDNICDALNQAGVKYDDDFFMQLDGGIKHNHFKG